MTTTFTPKRVVNGLPLTERGVHEYTFGPLVFAKTLGFWHAQAPDGSTSIGCFTLANAVTVAQSQGWVAPTDTCRWCSGHGFLRVPTSYFDLRVCEWCEGEGIDPQQPVSYSLGVTV